MIRNIKMLLSVRAWLKSRTLNFAGIVGLLATLDLTTPLPIVQVALDFMTGTFGIMNATAVAILFAVKAAADALLRAKTDRALPDK